MKIQSHIAEQTEKYNQLKKKELNNNLKIKNNVFMNDIMNSLKVNSLVNQQNTLKNWKMSLFNGLLRCNEDGFETLKLRLKKNAVDVYQGCKRKLQKKQQHHNHLNSPSQQTDYQLLDEFLLVQWHVD